MNFDNKKIIAIIASIFSVLIAVIYLGLTFVLDSRGPILPPPPEAFGVVVIESFL